MNITVFGGAQPKPGDEAYQDAQNLGYNLGKAGYTVLTGGYIGTMEAVSRGAYEAGSHVIGVTSEEIEKYRPSRANTWVKEERRHKTLHDRMIGLIDGCDAAIALPGGVGTLTEISLIWNRLLIGAIKPKPLVLVGAGWRAVFEQFFTSLDIYIRPEDKKWLHFAASADEAFVLVDKMLKR